MATLLLVSMFSQVYGQKLGPFPQDSAASKELLELTFRLEEGLQKPSDIIIREQLAMAAQFDTTNLQANFFAGRHHLLTVGFQDALYFLSRVYRQDSTYHLDLIFYLGEAHFGAENYPQAIAFYEEWLDYIVLQKGNDDPRREWVIRQIEVCQQGVE